MAQQRCGGGDPRSLARPLCLLLRPRSTTTAAAFRPSTSRPTTKPKPKPKPTFSSTISTNIVRTVAGPPNEATSNHRRRRQHQQQQQNVAHRGCRSFVHNASASTLTTTPSTSTLTRTLTRPPRTAAAAAAARPTFRRPRTRDDRRSDPLPLLGFGGGCGGGSECQTSNMPNEHDAGAAEAAAFLVGIGRKRRLRGHCPTHYLSQRTLSSQPPGRRESGGTADGGGGTGQEEEQDGTDPPPPLPPPKHPSSPLVDSLPAPLQPYARLARLDKPIGTMLLLYPCTWSTALAASPGSLPSPTLLVLFATGSFVMRGAGCTINDMWDSDFDRSVHRTKDRPLASGELNHRQALAFLSVQLTAGLGVLLSLPHTTYTFAVGSASLPLVVSYPLMKRCTNYPQLVLGMTFNWGALVGWAAVHGSLDWYVVGPLYASGVAWTMVYDTLYAHQDKVDDSKLGLKSTALHFGTKTKPILHGFSALALANWTVAGSALGFTSPLYYGGCALAYSHLAWQVQTADLDDPSNLSARFRSNNYVGAIVFGACVAGNLTAVAAG